MKKKMTDQHKLMAYVLHTQFNYTMTAIATLMKVSQSSISTSIKEVEYWKSIRDLTLQLEEAKTLLISQGISIDEPKIYLE